MRLVEPLGGLGEEVRDRLPPAENLSRAAGLEGDLDVGVEQSEELVRLTTAVQRKVPSRQTFALPRVSTVRRVTDAFSVCIGPPRRKVAAAGGSPTTRCSSGAPLDGGAIEGADQREDERHDQEQEEKLRQCDTAAYCKDQE
jgi:hypothetical protein